MRRLEIDLVHEQRVDVGHGSHVGFDGACDGTRIDDRRGRGAFEPETVCLREPHTGVVLEEAAVDRARAEPADMVEHRRAQHRPDAAAARARRDGHVDRRVVEIAPEVAEGVRVPDHTAVGLCHQADRLAALRNRRDAVPPCLHRDDGIWVRFASQGDDGLGVALCIERPDHSVFS